MQKTKILFIGYPDSSHTASWIELVQSDAFEARLFCLPAPNPPTNVGCHLYMTAPALGAGKALSAEVAYDPQVTPKRWLRDEVRKHAMPHLPKGLRDRFEARLRERSPASLEEALAKVLRDWQPDIVHTLGFDPASYFYLRTIRTQPVGRRARWIAQARGGPDLDLFVHLPERRAQIAEVMAHCDHYVCDNGRNYELAQELGLTRDKMENPGLGIISGPGGVDVEVLAAHAAGLPSTRERVIVWPKTYEVMSSKALPVFEALNMVWDRIQPCRVECLWLVQDVVRIWFDKLLRPEVKDGCRIHDRLPREQVLEMLGAARVMMAPSLTDGVPNAMLEAMALGAFPVVSPLDTITPVVRDKENVLFARNLFPHEIAAALERAMNDDELVDAAAERNRHRVREVSDRRRFRETVPAYYRAVAGLGIASSAAA